MLCIESDTEPLAEPTLLVDDSDGLVVVIDEADREPLSETTLFVGDSDELSDRVLSTLCDGEPLTDTTLLDGEPLRDNVAQAVFDILD